MESQRYYYRVSRLNDQPTTLMPGDVFTFSIQVLSHSIHTGVDDPTRLLHYCPSQSIPCHNFFQEGRDFLRTVLSRAHFFSVESLEEITEGVASSVQEWFQVDTSASPPPSLESQRREFPLELKIILFSSGVHAATEETVQCFRMIPASDEAVRTSLKKSTVVTRGECCPICLEELDVDAECRAMPCRHEFHLQCIVTWLQTSHVCPLCRYPLPTLKN